MVLPSKISPDELDELDPPGPAADDPALQSSSPQDDALVELVLFPSSAAPAPPMACLLALVLSEVDRGSREYLLLLKPPSKPLVLLVEVDVEPAELD